MNNNALVKKNQTRTSWWNLITESMRQLPHSRTNNWSTKPDISRVPYSDFWAQCFKKQVSGNKLPMLNKKSLTWKIGDIWWPILPACKRAAEQASLQISPFCFRINTGQSEIKHRGYSSTSGPPSLQHTHTVKTIPCYGPHRVLCNVTAGAKASQRSPFINNAHLFTSWLNLWWHWKKF